MADPQTLQQLPEFQVDEASGTARLGGAQIHSRHRPGEEIRAQCLSLEPSRAAILVFGFGLGHHIPVLREVCGGRDIVVIEPHPDVWQRALKTGAAGAAAAEHGEQSGVGGNDAGTVPSLPAVAAAPAGKLTYLPTSPDPEDFARQIERVLPSDALVVPDVVSLPAYANQFPALWKALSTRRERIREHRSINLATLARFGRLWLRNSFRNMQTYRSAGRLNQLVGSLRGAPTLLLAAGPSLDIVLGDLPSLAEHFIICAVDTAVRPCLAAGVDPDFVVVVDPQYWNSRHLDRCKLNQSKTRLVTELSVHPRCLGRYDVQTFLAASIFPLGEFIEGGRIARLGAGGSVATSAWDLLRQAGASDIVIAGLDLGFPGLQTHCAGAYAEESRHATASRHHSAETQAVNYLFSGAPHTVNDYAGGDLVSDRRMDVYAAWFEQRFREEARPGGVRTWNLGTASRALAGAHAVSLDELKARWTQPVADVRAALPVAAQDDAHAILGRLEMVRSEIEICRTESARAVDIVSRALALLQRSADAVPEAAARPDISGLVAALDDIDATIMGLESRRIVGFMFEDLLHQIQTMPDPETLEVSLERSKRMYEAFADSAAWLAVEIESSLDVSSSGR